MSDPSSGRGADDLAWDTLTAAQWKSLFLAAIQGGDSDAASAVLALMSVHGHPTVAEDLRRLILLMCAGGEPNE
mgnify:CR=1 FL=1